MTRLGAKTILKTLALVLADALAGGLLGAVFAFGALGLGASPGVILLGTLGALGAGALRILRTAKAPGMRWPQRMLHGLFAIVCLTALFQLHQLGALPVATGERTENFDRLCASLERHYPFFGEKDLDWADCKARYHAELADLQTDAAYHELVRRMLSEFDDAHTGVVEPAHHTLNGGTRWLGRVREAESAAVIDWVRPGVDLDGFAPGTIIETVNGLSPQQYFDTLDPVLLSGSSEQQKRYLAFARILALTGDEEKTLGLVTPDGRRLRRTVSWKEEYDGAMRAQSQPLIRARRLDSGIAVIRIPVFSNRSGHDLVAEFDACLDAVMDADGIILDLRWNTGGNSLLADRIAGRFLKEPFTYGIEHHRTRSAHVAWARTVRYRVRPRGETYTGPLAIITSRENMSTAESFIVSLADGGRALTVGSRTGGASGNPVRFHLSGGGVARFSTGAFMRMDGTPLEGRGIEPDVAAAYRVEDLQAGRDTVLRAAERALLTERTK